MVHRGQILYYAKEGDFETNTGQPYVGPYRQTPSGILVSVEGDVIVPQKNKQQAQSNPTTAPQPNTTLNENNTEYDLLPVRINNTPVIVKSIAEASIPQIKPSTAAGVLEGDYMFLFPDGSVKVHANTTITLQVEAEQPDTLNVENGQLIVKPSREELLYQWTVDGVPLSVFERDDSLRATRVVEGNKVIITNMIPKFAGTYNCIVSNDIGPTDAGSVNLEVYNSDVDSLFFTNLVANPNGAAEDQTLTTEGWQSVAGAIESKPLSPQTTGDRDKSIVVDPFNDRFTWTHEMMFPRPYQLDGGILQNNPLNNIKSYLTRQKYQYAFNNGITVMQAYQDIDLSDLELHIKGSIYGVSGLSAVVSCYLGMAIYNYEPAYPYILPNHRANPLNYYNGAARLSFENFYKMGPGFVKERAYVDVEEYDNGERVPSTYQGRLQVEPIRIIDPWNRRLSQYDNRVYYEGGGRKLLPPDGPSAGDNRDRHLFVADELYKTQEERYTFGQYAEFNRIVIDKINPRTNQIRLVYTVESLGNLDFTIYDRGREIFNQVSDGLLESPGWDGSWNSETAQNKSDNPTQERNVFDSIKANYKTNLPWEADIQQRVPKASDSRAFATGFNVTLVPLEVGGSAQAAINSIYTLNTRVEGLIPSPVNSNAGPYVAGDRGVRDLDISFVLVNSKQMNIQVVSSNPDVPESGIEQVDYSPGLMPFTVGSNVQMIQAPTVSNIQNVRRSNDIQSTSVPISPTTPTIAPYYIDTATSGNNTRFIELDPKGVFYGERKSGNVRIAPRLPLSWYTITKQDRLAIAANETTNTVYSKWAIPGSPLNYKQYREEWRPAFKQGSTDSAFIYTSAAEEEPLRVTNNIWNGVSRYLMTVGVHNANFETNNTGSLYAIDNYYLDFIDDSVVFHKTPKLYGLEFLPSFDDIEQTPDRSAALFQVASLKPSNDSDTLFFTDTRKITSMIPITIPVSRTPGDSDRVANFELPDQLLTNPRDLGGLGIPQILNEQNELVPDPSYKVVLYGMRPTPIGAQIDNFNEDSQPSLDTTKLTGTPLQGTNTTTGQVFVIRNLDVQNKTESSEN
jgi:hypothetical protein